MFDRLVRRAVLPHADGVVRQHVDDAAPHQRRQADGRTHVVREDEEGGAERDHSAVPRHPAEDRPHPVLAHPEMDVPTPRLRIGEKLTGLFHDRFRRGGQVRGSARQLRHLRGDRVQHLAGRTPGGRRAGLGQERRDPLRPSLGEIAPHPPLPFEGKRRERGGVRGELHPPLLLRLLPARQRLPEMGEHVVGHEEGRGGGPPEVFLREGDLGLPQRRPVRARGVLLVGAAVPDARANDHQGGALPLSVGHLDRRRHPGEIRVPVRDVQHVPTVRPESAPHVLAEGEVRRPFDGDPVVVVERHEVSQPLEAGQGRRLGGNPLHQVAVGAERHDPMGDDLVPGTVEPLRQHPGGHRHPDGVPQPLPQRARRHLDARGVSRLGVPRGLAPPLPELPQVVEGHVVPREVEQGVEEHGGVPAREDEPVASRPIRVQRVVPQVLRPQQVRQRRQPHRRAGVPRLRLLDRVDRQEPDGVDRPQRERAVLHGGLH